MRPRTGGRPGTELILVIVERSSPRSSGTRPYSGHQLLERQVARTDPVCGIALRLVLPGGCDLVEDLEGCRICSTARLRMCTRSARAKWFGSGLASSANSCS